MTSMMMEAEPLIPEALTHVSVNVMDVCDGSVLDASTIGTTIVAFPLACIGRVMVKAVRAMDFIFRAGLSLDQKATPGSDASMSPLNIN